jgi:hypothetical protein
MTTFELLSAFDPRVSNKISSPANVCIVGTGVEADSTLAVAGETTFSRTVTAGRRGLMSFAPRLPFLLERPRNHFAMIDAIF